MDQRASKPIPQVGLITDGHTVSLPEGDKTEEARLDIGRTRAHMGETLDRIGERLSPEHFKSAAVEAARATTHEVIDGVKRASWEVYDQARSRLLDTKQEIEGASMTVINTMKHNPIPTAMVGLGLYWLYRCLRENQVSSTPNEVKEEARQAGEKLSQEARELGDLALEKANDLKQAASERLDQGQRAMDGYLHMVHANPLVAAGVAAAIGVAFGMMLPDTEVENRAMGETRDEWVDRAQEKIPVALREIQDKAKEDEAVLVAGPKARAAAE